MTKVDRECLRGLQKPELDAVERIACEGDAAVACFDFDNTKRLLSNLEKLMIYAQTVDLRCRPAATTTEGTP